jgi:hypothetical protein
MPFLRAKTRSVVSQRPHSCRKHCSEPLSESGVRGTSFFLSTASKEAAHVHTCLHINLVGETYALYHEQERT